MTKILMKNITFGLILTFLMGCPLAVNSQTSSRNEVFGKMEMLSQANEKVKETDVRVRFKDDLMQIESVSGGEVYKTFKYSEIKNAEYSYTKTPRWKEGLGLGTSALIFPPMLLVAIPLGFTKHRRHWLTLRTDKDYAVLKLSKSTRKLFIPAFESYSSVTVEALGESK